MADGVRIQGNFDEVAEAYRGGDKVLRRHVGAALRGVAKPLGQIVIRQGADGLPKRGGLSARVAGGGKVGVASSLTGKSPSVTLKLQDRDGYQLEAMNRGQLRRPVFARGGDRKTAWVSQSIRPNVFTDAFEQRGGTKVRGELIDAAQSALAEIARDASS